MNDEQILQAVETTRSQWAKRLGEQEATDLAQWLTAAATGDPETIRQMTNRVLDLLQKHPHAYAKVVGALGIKGSLEAFRTYSPLAGEGGGVPAGTWMVCPQDPGHYRKRLRQKGQKLFCPEHGVPLVPADSIDA